jgi:hypothetical protein
VMKNVFICAIYFINKSSPSERCAWLQHRLLKVTRTGITRQLRQGSSLLFNWLCNGSFARTAKRNKPSWKPHGVLKKLAGIELQQAARVYTKKMPRQDWQGFTLNHTKPRKFLCRKQVASLCFYYGVKIRRAKAKHLFYRSIWRIPRWIY